MWSSSVTKTSQNNEDILLKQVKRCRTKIKKTWDNRIFCKSAQQSVAKDRRALNDLLAGYNEQRSNNKTAQARETMKKIDALLNKKLTITELTKIAGRAVRRFLKEKGQEWRANHLDPRIDRVLDSMSSLLSAGEQSLTGTCGLIPEVGGIVCAQFAIALQLAWDWGVRPELKSNAQRLLDQQIEAVIEKAVTAVESQIQARLSKKNTRKKSEKLGEIGEAIKPFVGSIVAKVTAELQSENVFRENLRHALEVRP